MNSKSILYIKCMENTGHLINTYLVNTQEYGDIDGENVDQMMVAIYKSLSELENSLIDPLSDKESIQFAKISLSNIFKKLKETLDAIEQYELINNENVLKNLKKERNALLNSIIEILNGVNIVPEKLEKVDFSVTDEEIEKIIEENEYYYKLFLNQNNIF